MDSLWQISTAECGGDKEAVMRRGNVYQLANGYMGYRGTLDESGPEDAVGVMLAGLFDQVGGAWREPVNAPNGAFTRVTLDGRELGVARGGVRKHRQTLQLTNAVFERETVFESGGKTLTLRSSRFLSVATPNLGVVELSITCDVAADVVLSTGIDGNVWDLNGPHLRCLTPTTAGDVLVLAAVTHEQGKPVVVAEALECDFGDETRIAADNRHLRLIRFRAEAGRSYALRKYFAVVTAHDVARAKVATRAVEIVRDARTAGRAACLTAHAAEWTRRWCACDVQIEGDDAAQLALRYSIFQLLMVAPVKGSANSIPARALSGQVYKGAIFWDTEMFMFPFFVHAFPETAVELLRYRIRTLDGARRKARSEGPGYRGAFYAWESQETGDDACTYFNIGDPITGRELRTHFRDKQVHISGDVAIALWEYFRVTGDDSLLLAGGAEVILECARFYASYAYFNSGRDRYEVLDVIGPDEYHERVHNNAFTSMVARETFAIAGAVAKHLGRKHPKAWRSLVKRLGIAAELAGFRERERKLFVPAPDARTGLIEQFEGYFKLRDTSVADLKARKIHPDEYLGAGQGLAVPTQVIKQADVVMMLNQFKTRFSAGTKRANWEYYEPRTEHGSSLSACAYALVATEFGKLDFAYEYFLKTARLDLEAKYKVYVGTIFMGGSHPAADGGAWMTAVLGFGGVRAEPAQLSLNPRLPAKWRSLRFNLRYRGDAFSVTVAPSGTELACPASNSRAHDVNIHGRVVKCRPGETVRVAARAPVQTKTRRTTAGRRAPAKRLTAA